MPLFIHYTCRLVPNIPYEQASLFSIHGNSPLPVVVDPPHYVLGSIRPEIQSERRGSSSSSERV